MRSDTRLAMREFRFLDEKRKLTRLREPEERRWLELKQALSAAAAQQLAGNNPAGANGRPAPPAEPPRSADAVQPSEVQSQWASSVAHRATADPPPGFPSFDMDLRLPAAGPPPAQLLGLAEPKASGEEVIELDPGDVTMVEADSNAAPDEVETRSEAPSEEDLPAIDLLPSDALDPEADEQSASVPPSAPLPPEVALPKLSRTTKPFAPSPPEAALQKLPKTTKPFAPSPPEAALPKLPRTTDPFGIPISAANASPAPPAVASEVDSQPENLRTPSSLEMPLEIRTDQAAVL